MQSREFNKMFEQPDVAKAWMEVKFAELNQEQQELMKLPTISDEAKRKIIEESEKPMPAELVRKIKSFIDKKRKEKISEQRIKRLVKRKFNITVY